MELRDSRYVVHEGCDHIFFVGFLGAGKSTLARNLGELFHRRYVDTDRLAERIAGKSLAEIYEDDGEELLGRQKLRFYTRLSLRSHCS